MTLSLRLLFVTSCCICCDAFVAILPMCSLGSSCCRCVDRMEIGYFWTYFFECEPGTVFADELDQCVHPYLAAPPCGSPPKTPKPTPTPTTTLTPVLCTGVDGTCKQYDICRPQRAKKTFCAEIRCNLRTSNLHCPTGMLFDMSTEQCAFPPKGEFY